MKHTTSTIFLLFLLIVILSSCKKEESITNPGGETYQIIQLQIDSRQYELKVLDNNYGYTYWGNPFSCLNGWVDPYGPAYERSLHIGASNASEPISLSLSLYQIGSPRPMFWGENISKRTFSMSDSIMVYGLLELNGTRYYSYISNIVNCTSNHPTFLDNTAYLKVDSLGRSEGKDKVEKGGFSFYAYNDFDKQKKQCVGVIKYK